MDSGFSEDVSVVPPFVSVSVVPDSDIPDSAVPDSVVPDSTDCEADSAVTGVSAFGLLHAARDIAITAAPIIAVIFLMILVLLYNSFAAVPRGHLLAWPTAL